jgi:hypothetical protein
VIQPMNSSRVFVTYSRWRWRHSHSKSSAGSPDSPPAQAQQINVVEPPQSVLDPEQLLMKNGRDDKAAIAQRIAPDDLLIRRRPSLPECNELPLLAILEERSGCDFLKSFPRTKHQSIDVMNV